MIVNAQQTARSSLSQAGDWLTAPQRLDVWSEARSAQDHPLDQARLDALSPGSVTGQHEPTEHLSAAAVEVVHRVASDPGRLTRSWADEHIDELGAATYTELVGVTAIATTIDRFDQAMGHVEQPLPEPETGQPARSVPADVGDVGAWVPQTLGATKANVSRTLSGVPVTNEAWRTLVDTHYSRGAEFMSLTWDRALSRPQVELVAARVTALSQCFY